MKYRKIYGRVVNLDSLSPTQQEILYEGRKKYRAAKSPGTFAGWLGTLEAIPNPLRATNRTSWSHEESLVSEVLWDLITRSCYETRLFQSFPTTEIPDDPFIEWNE